MARYIDVEALLEILSISPEFHGKGRVGRRLLMFTIELIQRYSATHGVEIVRCEDCGYYNEKRGVCMGIPTEPVVIRDPNDFCSRGERKDQSNG